MKKITIVFVLALGSMFGANAQSSLTNVNNYKYVIVPDKYDFLNEADKYRLNSLTRFLFKKYGFNTIMSTESYPDDLVKNRCLALNSDVKREKALLRTKLKVVMRDCNNEVIFESEIGQTKEKLFEKAYNIALRKAFESIEALEYNYVPNEDLEVSNSDDSTKEIEALKKEVAQLKKEKPIEVAAIIAVQESNIAVQESKPKTQEYSDNNVEEITEAEPMKENSKVLYAQEIENGYQLVDHTPKVVMILIKTSKPNVFIAKGKDAIVYEENGVWYVSKSNDREVLKIKF